MLLYIDSVFGEGRDREVKPLHTIPDTLNRLYLLAMREHDRDAVVLHRNRVEGGWDPTPDWRFDRHVIRLALYLQERVSFEAGDRAAIVSELRPEWLLADWAVMGLGGLSTAIGSDLEPDRILEALVETGPTVAFVSGDLLEELLPLRASLPGLKQIIAFDRPDVEGDSPIPEDQARPFSSVLDLGGTFDTPERAQAFRALAREVPADRAALRHYRRNPDGSVSPAELTQGEAIDRLKPFWIEQPARKGDLAYVTGPEVDLELRLALYGFVGDGYTTTVLGDTLADPTLEIADLRPHKIIGPSEILRSAVRNGAAQGREPESSRGTWFRRLARLTPAGRAREKRERVVRALGGRARWFGPTAPLDDGLWERLQAAIDVGWNGMKGPDAPGGDT